jgi:hypothetical protein
MEGLGGEEMSPARIPERSRPYGSCPRKTWQYFAQSVIQEDDPEKLTYLMQELYRVLKDDNEEQHTLSS